MLIAQLSDIHIKPRGRLAYQKVDTAACLQAAVAQVSRLPQAPDLVLLTGDLTDNGLAEEYGLLHELLAPIKAPLLVIPGNHDTREGMRAAFPAQFAGLPEGVLYRVVEDYPVRLVLLDSLLPGQGGGALGEAQLAWLEETLAAAPDRLTMVAIHHPPFHTGIGHMDKIGLSDQEAFAAVIRRHPQVERVICGHVHRPIQRRWAGTLASIAPSVAHQVPADLQPEAPSAFSLEPPGFQLHLFTPELGLVSHTVPIGEWPGPFPFFANGVLID